MIKRLALVIFLLGNVSFSLAQKTDSAVHVSLIKTKNIDGVLMSSVNDIVENLNRSPEFTTISNAIKTAGLTDVFKATGPITFFAPSNKAFDKLSPGTLDTLLQPPHKNELINLLKYHAVAGKITSKDIERQIKVGNGQTTLITLSGGTLTARINADRNIILTDENGGQSIVARLDIEQSNGMLFTVTSVLIPKARQ